MSSQWIKVKAAGGGQYEAYLSLPPAGSGPGLVLFEEIFGVNRHIRAVCDQYALDGFVVMAPDVFWRTAPREEFGYEGADREKALAAMKGQDWGKVGEDIKTTVAALRARPEVKGKMGAIGYCMGGRLAYFAAASTDVACAVSFYGGGIHDNLDRAASIKCPMQFHYAEKDQAIPLDAVERVKKAFVGKNAEFFVYKGAGHGFNCWDRSAYHAPSASLAHGRATEFLAKNLY